MADSTDAWRQVGDAFSRLGRLLEARFTADTGEAPSREPTEQEGPGDDLRQAVDRLVEQANVLADRTSGAFQDPEVRDASREAGRRFLDALATSVEALTDELRHLADRRPPET